MTPAPLNLDPLIAALLDRISLEQIAELTDRQIWDLYCHKRNKDGSVDATAEVEASSRQLTPTEEDALMLAMGEAFGMSPDALVKMQEQARARRQRTATAPATPKQG